MVEKKGPELSSSDGDTKFNNYLQSSYQWQQPED